MNRCPRSEIRRTVAGIPRAEAWIPSSNHAGERSALEETGTPERQPELMALLRVVRVDAQLSKPADAIDDGVAMHAKAFGCVTDAPAAEERLEGCHQFEPAVGG